MPNFMMPTVPCAPHLFQRRAPGTRWPVRTTSSPATDVASSSGSSGSGDKEMIDDATVDPVMPNAPYTLELVY
jgi:hypothetical protein